MPKNVIGDIERKAFIYNFLFGIDLLKCTQDQENTLYQIILKALVWNIVDLYFVDYKY